MKKTALVTGVLLLSLIWVNAALSSQTIKLSDIPNGVTLLEQNQSGLTIRANVGSLEATPVNTKPGEFVLLTGEGMTRSQRVGEPNLPLLNRLLALPIGSTISVEILSSESEEISLTDLAMTDPLIPVQPSLSKSQNPEDVPFEFSEEVYQRSGYYELPVAETSDLGIMRSVRIGLISVSPVQYNPTENTLKVFKELVIRVTFENADWPATQELYSKSYSSAFEAGYQQLFNYDAGLLGLRDDLTRYPIKYVIISHRQFETQLQPFIAWKVKKGFKVITAYSDIIGNTTTAIKSYLQNIYNSGTPEDPPPSFVLFVGDTPQIPTFTGTAASHETDLRYCEYTGDDFPEIYFGRWSAQNPSQLQPQIDKTLEYEQYTMPNPAYLGEVTLIAGVDAGYAPTYGNGQINYGTNLYFNALHGIYSNTWLYPASDQPGASAAIIQTVNEGIGFINYTAHGSHDGWADPSFSVSDINNLTNAHKYSLAIGNACLTNTFDESTPCFGEAWLQAANKGGVGYIGGSNNTYWDEDYWWGVGGGKAIIAAGPPYDATRLGAYDGLFHDHGEPVSKHYITNYALNMVGNLAVTQSGSSRSRYYWEIYQLMGDPSVMTYLGVPTANSVSHAGTILMTATTFHVEAAPGSYVGVSANGVWHGAAYVGTSGAVDVPIAAFGAPTTADIVVTAQNKVPYVTTVPVIAPNGPYVIYDEHTINDAAGNGNGVVDFGESIILGVQVINVGPDAASNVTATLSTTDGYVTITDNSENYGTIAGNSTTAYSANAFAFDVAASTPDDHRITFNLSVTDGDSVWSSNFSITTHAPAVNYLSIAINDASGNGNGKLDPGETADLVVTLKNDGSGMAYNVSGLLSEQDQYLTLTDNSGVFGNIVGSGGTGNNGGDVFVASADASCPMGHYVECTLALMADGGYTKNVTVNLTVGDRAPFFTEDFTLEQGWTGLGGLAEWQIGPAIGGSGGSGNPDPSEDHTPGADNFILGNDLTSSGTYESGIVGTHWVNSPIIDCSEITGVIMTYYHQLGVESPTYDHAYLEAYDGTGWQTLYTNAATVNESGWNETIYDLFAMADNNPLFQIRFGFGGTDGSVQYCGWNIDDIELKGYVSSSQGTAALEYTPESFADSLVEGETAVCPMKVKNAGQANLRVRFTPAQSWIQCSSQLYIIAPGDSLDLPVTIVSSGMAPGDHAGALNYTSNDLNHPSGSIPVNVYIYIPEMHCSPDSIGKRVAPAGQASAQFVIANTGPGKLNYSIVPEIDETKYAKPAVNPVNDPIGFRVADPDKTAFEEPYYAEVMKDLGGPDAFGYSWIDSDELGGPAFNWIDITTIGTQISLGDDSAYGPVNIGFGFPYYDSTYTDLFIGSNGILTFKLGSTSLSNQAMPNSAAPNNLIAMWWDDLAPNQGGSVYYYSDVANARFIVSFVNVRNYLYPGGTGSLTFQAIIYPNGQIRFQYDVMDPGADSDGLNGASIGIENGAGTVGLQVTYNAAYMHNQLAILFKGPTPSWLSVIPGSASVDPFEADTVTVMFEAGELENGVYTGRLNLACNDPLIPLEIVPVVMTVGSLFTTGDANGDDIVNISDVVFLVQYIFNGGTAPFPLERCDVNCDGIVNISDVVYLVQYIFAGGSAPCVH